MLEDPIFGIIYTPSVVKYDQIPARISQLCPGFAHGRWWLYAHLHAQNDDYFVVMGVQPGQDGDSFGTAVWIDGSNCRMTESMWVLSGVPPANGYTKTGFEGKLPGIDVPTPKACNANPFASCNYTLQFAREEVILRSLVEDAIQRAVKAYGGNAEFKKQGCSTSTISGTSNTPIVQQELQKFCSHPL